MGAVQQGCKNWFCFSVGVDSARALKIVNAMAEDDDEVDTPKNYIKIPYQDQAEEWRYHYATNTCYHVKHHASFNSLEFD